MLTRRVKVWAPALLVLLLSGCSLGADSPPAKTDPAPAPAPAPEPVKAPAASLLPDEDLEFQFRVQDFGVKQPYTVTEHLIRDGESVVAVYSGQPYARWEIKADGVWRLDPKAGVTLLRYLPPVLEESAWKQPNKGVEIWFRLTRKEGDCPTPDRTEGCWALTVLHGGEKTVFHFAPGIGPYEAKAINYIQQAASFDKVMEAKKPSGLSADQRAALLKRAPGLAEWLAPLTPVTMDEFAAAEKAQEQLKK